MGRHQTDAELIEEGHTILVWSLVQALDDDLQIARDNPCQAVAGGIGRGQPIRDVAGTTRQNAVQQIGQGAIVSGSLDAGSHPAEPSCK